MALTNSLVVLFIAVLLQIFYILTKLLQQRFLFFIVVVIPGHNLGNSQVSVNRTIGPTLVFKIILVISYPVFTFSYPSHFVPRIISYPV